MWSSALDCDCVGVDVVMWTFMFRDEQNKVPVGIDFFFFTEVMTKIGLVCSFSIMHVIF